jgi:SM-20-related protein
MTRASGAWPAPRVALEASEVQALGERGVFVRDGFLGRALASAVRGELDRLEPALRPAGMGRGAPARDARKRGDAIVWLDGAAAGPALAALHRALETLGHDLHRQAYLGLSTPEIQVARYPGGGARYVRHRDVFREAVGPQRRVTAIVYLNPGWDESAGGVLRLHLPDGALDVAPLLDRLVVFRSETVEHEVLPTYAPRWAATAWYRGP